MINAKTELLDVLKDTAKIKCAILQKDFKDEIILKLNYSEQDYNEFIGSLDFKYDNGYGWQELYGTVWLEDGTWLSRCQYDGSEWWDHNALPDIPAEVLR